jgi:pimeloyl-ACP methyl ester carboxylesterase
LIRRLLIRCAIFGVSLAAIALVSEYFLEVRDAARLLPGQNFATVGAAQIRYRLVGTERSGSPVVILAGMNGIIEQADALQSAVSAKVPCLTYDRAGYGFSRGSHAHTAQEQADELNGLLGALKIEKPVVIVSFSASAEVARVFAGGYPKKTAAIYMIDPPMPEINNLMPHPGDPRRYYSRWVVSGLLESSFGYIRLEQWLSSRGDKSPVEQRADAVLARRPHYWALAKEWYATPVSARQAIQAAIPPSLPLEIVYPKRIPEDEVSIAMSKAYADLVARSSHGKLAELDFVDHSKIIKSGPVLQQMVGRIIALSQETSS